MATATGMRERFIDEVRSELAKELGLSNLMAVPRIEKVTVNMGVVKPTGQPAASPRAGQAGREGKSEDRNVLDNAMRDLRQITGQQPMVTRARKSEAGFKIREGMPLGCKVTLRSRRMYEFLDRLVGIAIPRVRDFRGLNPRSMDGQGNFSMGLGEQIVFPEIDYDKIDRIRGLDITITTSATNDADGLALLRALKFPIRA
ncbi:MAG: 50S ribosomal protein L5 [Gammaproteobacteria bacterium]|nr:50S ribosomal protein L5 [Gammaproteobacteria bacterium]